MVEIFNFIQTIDMAQGTVMVANDHDKKAQKSKLIAWTIAVVAVALFALSFYLGAGTQ